MTEDMQLLTDFFNMLDGQKTWEEVRPVAEQLYHTEFRMLLNKDFLTKKSVLRSVENMLNAGVTIKLVSMEDTTSGIHYEYDARLSDGSVKRLAATGKFRDGALYHLEPDDQDAYDMVYTREIKTQGLPIQPAQ